MADLPPKVRRGLLEKADELAQSDDPASAHKRLTGPLQGYNRITYSRYRAIYSVHEERLKSGEMQLLIRIRFVAAGKRKEGDREDIYNFAMKLLRLGIIEPRE